MMKISAYENKFYSGHKFITFRCGLTLACVWIYKVKSQVQGVFNRYFVDF